MSIMPLNAPRVPSMSRNAAALVPLASSVSCNDSARDADVEASDCAVENNDIALSTADSAATRAASASTRR